MLNAKDTGGVFDDSDYFAVIEYVEGLKGIRHLELEETKT